MKCLPYYKQQHKTHSDNTVHFPHTLTPSHPHTLTPSPSHPHTLTDLDLEDLFLRLAREARAARPRPFPRDCFLVGVVRGVAGERGAVLSTLVLVVIGESGEEEMVGVCWVADVVLGS